MDSLTFIAEMTRALAWPAAVIVAVLLLRKPLSGLIPLIQRLRYGGLELDFGRRVHELAVEAARELPAESGRGQPRSDLENHLAGLAQASPRAAVLEAWLEVEAAAMEASRREKLALSSRELRTPLLLGEALELAGVLEGRRLEIFHRLRILRNGAAHASEFDLDSDSALEYANLALRLAAYLRRSRPSS